MGTIIKYIHHGKKVSVDVLLKGKHRYHCLCWRCKHFKPSQGDSNCDIAEMLYRICKLHSVVTPVWECPLFEESKPAALALESVLTKEDRK